MRSGRCTRSGSRSRPHTTWSQRHPGCLLEVILEADVPPCPLDSDRLAHASTPAVQMVQSSWRFSGTKLVGGSFSSFKSTTSMQRTNGSFRRVWTSFESRDLSLMGEWRSSTIAWATRGT